MTLMRVRAFRPDHRARAAALVLEEVVGQRALGFLVPTNEVNRLARVLGLTGCCCAPVYELVIDPATELGVSVVPAVVDGEAEGLCATLVLDRNGALLVLACHPADAITLTRAGAPSLSHRVPSIERTRSWMRSQGCCHARSFLPLDLCCIIPASRDPGSDEPQGNASRNNDDGEADERKSETGQVRHRKTLGSVSD